MNDQFKDFENVPTPVLTFGAPAEEEKETEIVEAPKPAEPQLDESILSEEER